METSASSAFFRDLRDPEIQREVAKLRYADNFTNWWYLFLEYAFLAIVIGSTISFYYWLIAHEHSLLWSIPVTIVCIYCVGAGQHRLATLTHEAAHYMLFKNRLLNEFVSEWFCMFPVLGTTHSYRVQHHGHHQFPNDPERDPDWAQLTLSGHKFKFPMTTREFLWQCVFKQLLWPPALIRYVLVRASFLVNHGTDGPYRMKRLQAKTVLRLRLAYHLLLVAAVTAFVVWEMPREIILTCVGMLIGILAILAWLPEAWFAQYTIEPDISVRHQTMLRFVFNTLLIGGIGWLTVVTAMPWWLFYIVLWLVPLGSSFAFFMILRQLVQHGNADRERFTNTRVFLVHPLIRLAVFPIGNDYHLPHHLFPLVPHFNLPKLHALLMTTEPYHREAVEVHGYFFSPESPKIHPTVLDLLTR